MFLAVESSKDTERLKTNLAGEKTGPDGKKEADDADNAVNDDDNDKEGEDDGTLSVNVIFNRVSKVIQNCSVLVLFRFVVGPDFLKQSHAKLKPITTLLPAFSVL